MKQKMTFALCFCNRGFMPGELIYGATTWSRLSPTPAMIIS